MVLAQRSYRIVPMDIHEISRTKEFAGLRQEWNALLSRSTADTIFLTWEWAYTWWESFGTQEHSLFILTAFDDNALVGIAPMYIHHKKRSAFLKVNEIRFLGERFVHGEYLDFILDPDVSQARVLKAFFHYLETSDRQWDFARLSGIPETSNTLQSDVQVGHRIKFFQISSATCPYVVLPDNWDEFKKKRKKKLGRKFEYQRQLQRQFGARLTLCDTRYLQTGVDTLFRLHEQLWQSRGQSGAFTREEKRRFYHSIAQRFSDKGWLRLWILTMPDQPIATLFGFEYKKSIAYLQSGYDPEWAKYSVAQVILALIFEQAIHNGCSEFDFLRGREPYKYRWGAVERDTITLEVYKRTTKARIYRILGTLKKGVTSKRP